MDDKNIASIAIKIPVYDPGTLQMSLVSRHLPEIFWEYVRALRFVWQKKYHEDLYYQDSPSGIGGIWDVLAIDADAFATAYVFSDRTPYTAEDFPVYLDEICLSLMADDGRRWERIKEFSQKYGLENEKKLEVIRQRQMDNNSLKVFSALTKSLRSR